ncbi:MAG: MarR family winged helix-turn-helix transcriptional regulator [Methylovirgula sp.]
MPSELNIATACNCLAVRQAARRITQLYDRFLAPSALRTTQFSILSWLSRAGPMSIHALAQAMVMDRTTLGRNILPLERERLIAVRQSTEDRRSKLLHVTPEGLARLKEANAGWKQAQSAFEGAFGAERAAALRAVLHDVAALNLD